MRSPTDAEDLAERLLTERRAECYCHKYRKPCIECQCYEAGMDDLIEALGNGSTTPEAGPE